MTFVSVTHGGRIAWKTWEYPLWWSKTSVSRNLIGGVQAFAENPVHQFSACDFRHHLLEHGTSSFYSSNLFWRFQSNRSDHHTVLGKSRTEDASIAYSSIIANKPRPTSPTRPAMYESSLTCMRRWRTKDLGFSHNLYLIVRGSHSNSIQD